MAGLHARGRVIAKFREGRSASQAAHELGYPQRYVLGVYKELCRDYVWTPRLEAALRTTWENDVPVARIADLLECSPTLASRKALDMGLKARKGWPLARKAMEAKAAMEQRSCMCCRRTFRSEGMHNRLCGDCKRGSNLDYATPRYGAGAARGRF